MAIYEIKQDESPQGQYKYYMNKSKDWLASELVEKNKQLKKLHLQWLGMKSEVTLCHKQLNLPQPPKDK